VHRAQARDSCFLLTTVYLLYSQIALLAKFECKLGRSLESSLRRYAYYIDISLEMQYCLAVCTMYMFFNMLTRYSCQAYSFIILEMKYMRIYYLSTFVGHPNMLIRLLYLQYVIA